jgi:hypothetical protein
LPFNCNGKVYLNKQIRILKIGVVQKNTKLNFKKNRLRGNNENKKAPLIINGAFLLIRY